MTHTLHRRLSAESLNQDFVVLTMRAKGFNDKGCEPRVREFLWIAFRHNAKNFGSGAKRHGKDTPEGKIASAGSIATAVFDNREDLTAFLKEVKDAALGLSVVVSGHYGTVDECLRVIGLEHHTASFSLGVWGKTERLPDDNVLQITTMCGHGLISSNLAEEMVREIRAGRKTPEEATEVIKPQCACGIFNPSVAARLLKEMAGKAEID
jgi:hypothetical protein